ncbi:unnamed protein product [Rotaria sp. Silwood1]|nr:unnamed protein product [Rotaria sp. Silwood1]
MYDSGTTTIGEYTLIYSGHSSADKTRSAHGVAIFLNKQAATAWKTLGSTWEAVNERIVMVRLACKPINVTVIAIYAPINPKNQQQASSTTDPFYADLQATIKKVPKSDMLLIIGDFNARVGQEQHRTNSNVKIEARQVEYWDELSIEIENAIKQHDPATAYAMIRRLRGGRAKIENLPIFDKQGCLLTNSNERLNHWKDYFNDLLSVPSIVDQATIQQIPSATITVSEQERQDQIPTLNQVQCAIKQMKNGKAPGSNGISIDVIKAGGLPLAKWLHEIFVDIWENEIMIENWTTTILIRLYKNKGDKKICDNYRGISLLVVTSKIFSRIILNRVQGLLDKQLLEEQAGFRSNRSTIDQIFILKMIMEKSRNKNKPLHICFIDIMKAYDSVDRVLL